VTAPVCREVPYPYLLIIGDQNLMGLAKMPRLPMSQVHF